MSDPQPLEYEQVQPPRPTGIRVGVHAVIAMYAAVYLAIPMVALMLIVPRFEAVFRDFKTQLPSITELVLRTSRWTANQYGWVFVLPLIVAAVLPGLLLDLRGTSDAGLRVYRRVARLLMLLAMLVVTAIIALACLMPMISLIESVSGGARK